VSTADLIFYGLCLLMLGLFLYAVRDKRRTDAALREMTAHALRDVARIAEASESLAGRHLEEPPPLAIGWRRIMLDEQRSERFRAIARERGVAVEQVVVEAVDAYLSQER
jgi:hypothetical protein